MNRWHLDAAHRAERDAARVAILRRVNRFVLAAADRRAPQFPARLLGARQIQQAAVCIARRNRLVGDELLAAAGFRSAKAAA